MDDIQKEYVSIRDSEYPGYVYVSIPKKNIEDANNFLRKHKELWKMKRCIVYNIYKVTARYYGHFYEKLGDDKN